MDGAPTTAQLTTASDNYPFVGGRIITTPAPFTYTFATHTRTEFEYVIKPTPIAKLSTTYYFRTDQPGTDQNVLPTLTTASALPVSLVSFSVAENSGKALVKWTTANEVSNDHFSVMRSSDGRNFQTIATVKAKGNGSTTPTGYEFTDNAPLNGKSYYRLQQWDVNGKATLSTVQNLTLGNVRNMAASIYPNPTAAAINVVVKDFTGAITATVTNTQGTVVHREVIAVTASTSAYKLNLNKKLPSGTYYVNLTGSNLSQKLKVIVQ